MKVLILSHMYPKQYYPEYGIFVHQQVKALVRRGHEVRVVSPTLYVPPFFEYIKPKWKQYRDQTAAGAVDGIQVLYPRVVRLPGGYDLHYSGRIYYLAAKKLIASIYREFPFELIHSHVALPDGFFGSLLKEQYGVPLVTTIHGKDFQTGIYRNEKSRKAVIQVLKSSDRVITVSEKLRRIGMDLLPEAQKYHTIHNGIDLESVQEQGDYLKEKHPGSRILLSVGNLKKTKGFDLMLKAFARLLPTYPDLRLVIAGDGMERQNLEKISMGLNISDKVEFLGKISHPEVMKWMAACEVFVLPSWQEGFGMVYVEAMAHAKPVVGCAGEGIADVIQDGENGILVAPKSVDDLADRLGRLLRDEKLRLRMGQRAQETVQNGLTWDVNALRVEEVYREVLGK